MTKAFVAVDLGAESGRIVALLLDKDARRFALHEAHRFATNTLQLPSGLHWDVSGIWREIISGMVLVAGWASENGHEVCSIGVDSNCWVCLMPIGTPATTLHTKPLLSKFPSNRSIG